MDTISFFVCVCVIVFQMLLILLMIGEGNGELDQLNFADMRWGFLEFGDQCK